VHAPLTYVIQANTHMIASIMRYTLDARKKRCQNRAVKSSIPASDSMARCRHTVTQVCLSAMSSAAGKQHPTKSHVRPLHRSECDQTDQEDQNKLEARGDGDQQEPNSAHTHGVVATVSCSAATRVCAAIIESLARSDTEDDMQLLDQVLTSMLDRLADSGGTNAPMARAIASTVLPKFSKAKHGERILQFALHTVALKDKASALLVLCSCPAALLALALENQLARDACGLIRSGVSDVNYTIRKRAHFLISVAVEHSWAALVQAVGWSGGTWAAYLAILDACEDTSSHLVNAAWEQLPTARCACCAALELSLCVVGELLHRLEASREPHVEDVCTCSLFSCLRMFSVSCIHFISWIRTAAFWLVSLQRSCKII
jgi:hypothetical protein